MAEKRILRSKLASNSGASIVIALVYFLICAMVGAVVLASAKANVSHNKSQKMNEQNYLAVMSAAKIMEKQVKNCEIELPQKSWTDDSSTTVEADLNEIPWENAFENKIQNQMIPEILSFLNEDNEKTIKTTISVDGNSKIPEVNCNIKIVSGDWTNGEPQNTNEFYSRQLEIISDLSCGNPSYNLKMISNAEVSYCLDEDEEEELNENGEVIGTTYTYTREVSIVIHDPIYQKGEAKISDENKS